MEESPFDFQSDHFENYEDFLSVNDTVDFNNTEWGTYNFDCPAELYGQEMPGLTPDSSKDQAENSPKSQTVSPDGMQVDAPSTHQASDTTSATRSQKSHARFSKKARSVLRTWFNNHKDHPYPTPAEKAKLEEETGLQRSQVAFWLANARRRYKPRPQNSSLSLDSGDLPEIPEIQSFSQPPEQSISLLMPPPPLPQYSLPLVTEDEQANLVFSDLKPFDRWKIDYRLWHEPAEMENISNAMAHSPPAPSEPAEILPYTDTPNEDVASNVLDFGTAASTSEFDAFWAQSMASYSTGLTGLGSTSRFSEHTAISHQPSSASFFDTKSLNSFEDAKPRRRCKAKRALKERSQGGKFHCTFCSNRTFRTKHDWQRHEKSQHLNIESWACCAFGPTIESPQGPICGFCNHPNPDSDHVETHHYSACQEKLLSERTFYRKDHFKQHLKLVHECDINPSMSIWKVEFPNIISRCGFCNLQLNSWQDRVDHLAAHFKAGSKMAEWKGDLGFEAHVACIIDFGTDFDPKRFDPELCWTTESLEARSVWSGTQAEVSSLNYQGDAGSELGDELLNGTLAAGSKLPNGTLVSEGGFAVCGAPHGEMGLYDIQECAPGTTFY